jgi:hypothetical protein
MKKFRPHWFCYLESDRAGSGWRLVEVLKFGYKWVRLRTVDVSFRMNRKAWDNVTKCPYVRKKVLYEEKGKHEGVAVWGKEKETNTEAPQKGRRSRSEAVTDAPAAKRSA